MDADDTRVFAFTGFPPQADPAEALTLIKDYIHDFLGNFAAVVLGVCVGDGEIGVSYPVSQGEAIHATIHELRDKFVYRGVTLTTCDVDMLVVSKFQMPRDPGLASASGAAPALAPGPVAAPRVPVVPQGPSPH